MGKIIDFGKLRNEQEPALAVERTESFYSTARELSDFIAALPISREENDRLIVAPVDSNTVVPDGGSRVDGLIQMAVPLTAVQLILIGFYHLHGYSSFLGIYIHHTISRKYVQPRLISPLLKQGVLRRN